MGTFAASVDVDRSNQLGAKPILPTLSTMDALTNKRGLARLLANPAYLAAGFVKLESEEDAEDSKKQIAEIGKQVCLFQTATTTCSTMSRRPKYTRNT